MTALNTLLRHRRLIVALTIALGGSAAVMTKLQPDTYIGAASFVPTARDEPTGQLAGLAVQLGLGGGSNAGPQSPAFYSQLLTSRSVLEAVALSTYPLDSAGVSQGTLIEALGVVGETPELQQTAVINRLRRAMRTGFDAQTGVVSFDIKLPSRRLAEAVAARLLELVNDFNVRNRVTGAREERSFVEARVAEAKAELEAAEQLHASWLNANRVIVAPQLVFENARLERQVRMQEALYTSLMQSYEQARIDEIRNTPVITILERPYSFPRPASKMTLTIAAFGAVLGALLGMMLAFVLDMGRNQREANDAALEEFRRLRRATWKDATFGLFSRRQSSGES